MSNDEVEALFALIYFLKDKPLQSLEEAERLRAEEARRKATALANAREFAPAPGVRVVQPKQGQSSLADHIVAARRSVDRWFSFGQPPPVLPLAGIQFKLIDAKAHALEKAFLGVVCRHFGGQFGQRYEVLVERATECGVYPLREATPVAPAPTPALFDDFVLDGAQTEDAPLAAAPATAKRQETAPIRPGSMPLRETPRAALNRRARVALHPSEPVPARKRLWGLFSTIVR